MDFVQVSKFAFYFIVTLKWSLTKLENFKLLLVPRFLKNTES